MKTTSPFGFARSLIFAAPMVALPACALPQTDGGGSPQDAPAAAESEDPLGESEGVQATAEGEQTETVQDALKRASAIARAEEWVKAKLHYCQSPNHEPDGDPACSSVCERKNDKQWNPYRSDCSGLVSWSWALPPPGRVTWEFAPYQDDITHAIAASQLSPGDAVNNMDHVMLFKHWVVKNHKATFIEEPGCSSATPYAHEFTSSVQISGHHIHVSHNGMNFTAIRFKGLH